MTLLRNSQVGKRLNENQSFVTRDNIWMRSRHFPVRCSAIVNPIPDAIDIRHRSSEISNKSPFDQRRSIRNVRGNLKVFYCFPKPSVVRIGARFL